MQQIWRMGKVLNSFFFNYVKPCSISWRSDNRSVRPQRSIRIQIVQSDCQRLLSVGPAVLWTVIRRSVKWSICILVSPISNRTRCRRIRKILCTLTPLWLCQCILGCFFDEKQKKIIKKNIFSLLD